MLADSNFSMNLGRTPVGFMRPTILPPSTPVCSKTNISCMTITSPSMPCTSVTLVILREPSFRRSCCTITSTAADTCSRIAFTGNSIPAMSTIVSRRERQSLGELAWAVVKEPSWPVFRACRLHYHLTARRSLLADGLPGQFHPRHEHHSLKTREAVSRRVGVGGGQGAVVARVHGLEHVQCLATAHLSDYDPVGAH